MGGPLFSCHGKESRSNPGPFGQPGKPICTEVDNVGWVLEGIASWTTNPCGYNFPGVYTKIDTYVDWIKSVISTPPTTTTTPSPTTTTESITKTDTPLEPTTTVETPTSTSPPEPTTTAINTTQEPTSTATTEPTPEPSSETNTTPPSSTSTKSTQLVSVA